MANTKTMSKRLTPRTLSLTLILIPLLYIATLAQSLVLGDPTEYTFVANILGIAHPPGYAFITLLGKLFQTLIPFGEIPWRMHLLSATVATLAALAVFGTIRTLVRAMQLPGEAAQPGSEWWGMLAALFGAFSVAFGANYWQHAIHANPHIITATFLAVNLFLLTRWWADERRGAARAQRWLLAFSFVAGLGVTHHPLTVFSFPAYALFVVWVRPSLLRDWRTLLKMVGLALLGLSLWLYFPIRSGMQPAFGPSTMNTWDGFTAHVLGRGITEALTYYSLAEQPVRALVFWSILRLQYALPVIFLALIALLWPVVDLATRARRITPAPRLPLLLYALAFVTNYAFVISLRAQDIMAYLLGPLLIVGLLAGVGLFALLQNAQARLRLAPTPLMLLVGALFLLGPVQQVVGNAGLVSLRGYSEGSDYVQAVFERFDERGEGAVLLNDWERMTPLWYTQLVEERWPDPADVRPEFVSTARTWLENVFDYLPGGPVYLSGYRRDVVDAGFRLRPFGPFYRVVEPGDSSLPPELTPVSALGGDVEMVGYLLPETAVSAGDYVPLTLAMRVPQATADYYVPVVRVGELSLPFTTDSHLVTPSWQPGEIIVERFDFALPHALPAGNYPVSVGLKNLSTNSDTELELPLGTLSVAAVVAPIPTGDLLANFRQRVGLVQAAACVDGRRISAPWTEPLRAQPGDIIPVTLQWRALDYAEESYTVFVHLIDLANRPLVALDYTPLGGAMPTHLWIPKWLPGQQMLDPYRLQIPPDLPPGEYLIEVGLYEMTSGRRLHIADQLGNLVGDRYILGSVIVEE